MSKKVELDMKILIVAVALIIVATVGSAFTTYLIFGRGADIGMGSGEGNGGDSGPEKRALGPTFNVGEFTVNLSTTSVQTRFIRTGIVLELSESKMAAELEHRQPQIRDRIISILRTISPEQLRSPEDLEILRVRIIDSINELILRGEVKDVFFIDLVVQ